MAGAAEIRRMAVVGKLNGAFVSFMQRLDQLGGDKTGIYERQRSIGIWLKFFDSFAKSKQCSAGLSETVQGAAQFHEIWTRLGFKSWEYVVLLRSLIQIDCIQGKKRDAV